MSLNLRLYVASARAIAITTLKQQIGSRMSQPTLLQVAITRVGCVIDEAAALQWTTDDRFDPVDLENSDLKGKLTLIAVIRPLSLQDIINCHAEILAKESDALLKIFERMDRCRAKSDALMLYRVTNTAKRSIDILAASVDCARLLAREHGHVQEEKNANIRCYAEEYVQQLRANGSAIGRAMREGVPGVLENIGLGAVIKQAGKVYVPMSLVKA